MVVVLMMTVSDVSNIPVCRSRAHPRAFFSGGIIVEVCTVIYVLVIALASALAHAVV